jgi:hypothetical protein
MPNAAKNSKPKNAFERAEASILAIRISWWEALIEAVASGEIEAKISNPEFIDFGEDLTLGRMLLERRTITKKLRQPLGRFLAPFLIDLARYRWLISLQSQKTYSIIRKKNGGKRISQI